MKKHYVTHVEDTDKSISVAGPVLDYKQWYTDYIKLMEEQAQRKYGLYTPEDAFPTLPGDVTRWSFKGLTNEQMSKNPSLEDADGKGRFLTFKNFAWSGMSGCGGYSLSEETFSYTLDIYNLNFTDPSVSTKEYDVYFQLIGLDENSGVSFNLDVREYGTAKKIKRETYTKDGIYHFEYKSEDDTASLYMAGYNGVGTGRTTFTVKILPYYPGFIISDGVDDCAVTEKDLDFEDTYTVYTAFIPFQEDPARNMLLCGKAYKKDFYVQYQNLNKLMYYSAGTRAIVEFSNGFNLIACKRTPTQMVAKNLLTGETIVVDANSLVENPGLYYLWTTSSKMEYAKAAIAGQVICNGHFTTDEEDTKVLNWYKKEYPWLFFDQAWTVTGKTNEDTDRATIANITGNGNNLILSNFRFARNSGYGEWSISFPSNLTIDQPYGTLHFREGRDYSNPVYNGTGRIEIKFTIRGLVEDGSFAIRAFNKDISQQLDFKTYTENGTYTYVFESNENFSIITYNGLNNNYPRTDFYVDIIPEYEGYLVTDGVDDRIESAKFNVNKDFAVVGEWELLDSVSTSSGIAKPNSFYLYSRTNGLGFYCKNASLGKFLNLKSIAAFNSKGIAYDHKWEEYINDYLGNDDGYYSTLFMGFGNNSFSKVVFKNLAIYPKALSKEDCIKAYIYLQTLKAK